MVLFLCKPRGAMAIYGLSPCPRKFFVFRFCLDFETCAKENWQQEPLSPSQRSLCDDQHHVVPTEDEVMVCVLVQTNFVLTLYRVTGPSTTPARNAEPCRKHITINRAHPRHFAVGTAGILMKLARVSPRVEFEVIKSSEIPEKMNTKPDPVPHPRLQRGRTFTVAVASSAVLVSCSAFSTSNTIERNGGALGVRFLGRQETNTLTSTLCWGKSINEETQLSESR